MVALPQNTTSWGTYKKPVMKRYDVYVARWPLRAASLSSRTRDTALVVGGRPPPPPPAGHQGILPLILGCRVLRKFSRAGSGPLSSRWTGES